MENFTKEEIEKLPYRKRLEMKWYPYIKWFYFKGYSVYGFYWGYKLYKHNYELPYWEQWALWLFAMLSLYFLEERNDWIAFLENMIKKLIKKNKCKSGDYIYRT